MRNELGQFVKGSSPPNKGKKMEEWMSPEMIEKTKATRFKKGIVPPNTKPLGTVTRVAHKRYGVLVGYDWYINIDRHGKLHGHYNYRKWLWERENDEDAPENAIFVALNGNQAEKPTIENVEMIDRKELLRRNAGRRS